VYLSREYISELGGTLNVISAVGEGTTITITLPLNEPHQQGFMSFHEQTVQ
jgi:signal transduction histidine kinase